MIFSITDSGVEDSTPENINENDVENVESTKDDTAVSTADSTEDDTSDSTSDSIGDNNVSESESEVIESNEGINDSGSSSGVSVPDDYYTTVQFNLCFSSFALSLIIGLLVFLIFVQGLKK